ncbi:hypothetical protein MMC13_007008 [Lambiella insularis]|nr:hypothetical protein [Lambiella insularis]
MGPPPYKSPHASIKYILCLTLLIRISGKVSFVRTSQEIIVLTVHDPEKALVNLPYPLTASDELRFSKYGAHDMVKMTAGIHRQTWVSGIALFVDIHVSNSSQKTIKRIDLQLERATTFYDHAPASTSVEVATYLRLPDKTVREILLKRALKKERHGWQGISPQSQDVRTCYLDIPPGLATIDTGRFFGIRYFLNVLVSCSLKKTLFVQIPITIIHPNSLDIVPNSVAQVASAIEHRHLRRQRSTISRLADSFGSPNGSLKPEQHSPYRYTQGKAFSAARRRSTEQCNTVSIEADGMEELTRRLDGSPRKAGPSGKSILAGHRPGVSRESNGMKENITPMRQDKHRFTVPAPRLMRSTSGLGFDNSSDEEHEYVENGMGEYYHGMYRQKTKQTANDGPKPETEMLRRDRRSLDNIRPGGGWRNVAVEYSRYGGRGL